MVEGNQKYKAILLFGMPGSGKGTQGAILNGLPSLIHVSMGDIFRKIPRNGKFGREIEQYTIAGPDGARRPHRPDLPAASHDHGDAGAADARGPLPGPRRPPRTYAQAERLDGILDVIQIFHLKITDTKQTMDRLRARALSENRLDDMSDEVIHRRLQTYYDETFKTLSFYRSDLICDIDASRRAVDVLRDIVNRLAEILPNGEAESACRPNSMEVNPDTASTTQEHPRT